VNSQDLPTHKTRIAERILGLVTTRDRAACIAGDLTEVAAARSDIMFWASVFGTATSLLWREIAEHPAHLTGLALAGLAVYIVIDGLFAGLDGVAFFIAALSGGNHIQPDSIGWKIWFVVPVLVSSLLIGRMLARWARGLEMAACAVYAVFVSIYNLVPALGNNGTLTAVFCVLVVPAGAAWGCYRSLVARPPRPL
jgi:hypothetical protein